MAETRDEDFALFVRETRPALRRTAFRLSDDWYEADDLVQRTLMALHRHWDRLDGGTGSRAYARTIMLRLLISDRRSLRWSREVLIELLPEPAPISDPYALVGERLQLMDALSVLGPRQRAPWSSATGRTAVWRRPPRSWAVNPRPCAARPSAR